MIYEKMGVELPGWRALMADLKQRRFSLTQDGPAERFFAYVRGRNLGTVSYCGDHKTVVFSVVTDLNSWYTGPAQFWLGANNFSCVIGDHLECRCGVHFPKD